MCFEGVLPTRPRRFNRRPEEGTEPPGGWNGAVGGRTEPPGGEWSPQPWPPPPRTAGPGGKMRGAGAPRRPPAAGWPQGTRLGEKRAFLGSSSRGPRPPSHEPGSGLPGAGGPVGSGTGGGSAAGPCGAAPGRCRPPGHCGYRQGVKSGTGAEGNEQQDELEPG